VSSLFSETMPEPESLDSACRRLAESIELLRANPADEERQRTVCLDTRTVDAILQIDATFSEELLPDDVDRVRRLLQQASRLLPEDSSYWQSVENRLEELDVFEEQFRNGRACLS
jgi:hypothetical protein